MAGPTAARALAGRLALSMVVAGCLVACTSGAGSPGTLPAVTPHPTTSTVTAPSPTPSTDEAAIEAAVRSYYDAMDTALSSGEVALFVAATTDQCRCRALADSVTAAFDAGRIEGASIKVKVVRVQSVRGQSAKASATYDSAPYRIFGNGVKEYPGATVDSLVTVQQVGGVWLVANENLIDSATQ